MVLLRNNKTPELGKFVIEHSQSFLLWTLCILDFATAKLYVFLITHAFDKQRTIREKA